MKNIVAYERNNSRASAKRAKKQRCRTVCIHEGVTKRHSLYHLLIKCYFVVIERNGCIGGALLGPYPRALRTMLGSAIFEIYFLPFLSEKP